jgi:SAM-dependent methyltransferase
MSERVRCRVCGEALFPAPLLHYRNMPCAAQGFPDATMLAQDRGMDLVLRQCSGCGLVQLIRAPVPYYREVIRAVAFSDSMRAFRETQFADWVRRYCLSGRKVIELGCGRGEYLALLQATGARVSGLEYADVAVRDCRARGLSVTRGYLCRRTQRLREAPFDAFISLNFLEHWPDPVAGLRGMWHNLNPQGVGLVEVPNFDMIMRQGLFSEFIADHLLYFTEDTLRFTLRRSGFDVLGCRSVWHDYILSAEVRKRAPLGIDHLEQRRTAITDALRAFIARFPAGQVAIWGAGHQALAVIALTDIAPDVRYIVDSAPFKQNRYSPASHLRIVAPDILLSEPVQAVIVMAASYSDEVTSILRHRFGAELVVAVLRDDGLEAA